MIQAVNKLQDPLADLMAKFREWKHELLKKERKQIESVPSRVLDREIENLRGRLIGLQHAIDVLEIGKNDLELPFAGSAP